jgi:hypothetical protein
LYHQAANLSRESQENAVYFSFYIKIEEVLCVIGGMLTTQVVFEETHANLSKGLNELLIANKCNACLTCLETVNAPLWFSRYTQYDSQDPSAILKKSIVNLKAVEYVNTILIVVHVSRYFLFLNVSEFQQMMPNCPTIISLLHVKVKRNRSLRAVNIFL